MQLVPHSMIVGQDYGSDAVRIALHPSHTNAGN